MTRARTIAASAVGFAAILTSAPAHALPTMIRLGYTDCASCHISPQGGGPLNAYGRGIDAAQSLSGGEYEPSPDTRLTHDVRFHLQEQGAWPSTTPRTNFFRPRLMYRNVTNISGAFRVSGMVTVEGREAPRPGLSYDPSARGSTLFVNTALIHYKPAAALELAFGRDQLPTGVNVPDLAAFIKSRNRLGYYDAPTQLKVFWSAKRYHVTPFVYAPGGNEAAGERESGAGSLAEVDLIGNQRLVGGATLVRGTAARGDRRTVGAYARLGFGQWGILAEHDVTDRARLDPIAAGFRQTASYAQVFWAIREWFVASGTGEQLHVDAPFQEHLVAGRLELAARLSPKATVVLATRLERNMRTARITPSVTLQAAFKTVQ